MTPHELQDLGQWCRAIAEFLTSEPRLPEGQAFLDAIDKAVEQGNARGLKMAERDLAAWARSISPERQEELERTLVARFGRGLQQELNDELREIQQIVARGKIATPDEYRLVVSRLDEIYADESKQQEVRTLNDLMTEYDKLAAPEN